MVPKFGSFFTMNMVHIYKTQKAILALLKVTFNILNNVEGCKLKTVTSYFYIMVE